MWDRRILKGRGFALDALVSPSHARPASNHISASCAASQRFKQELSPQAWKMFKEAANPAQQAAIAINMKKHHVKPKHVNEDAIPGKMVTQGFVVEYDPATRTTVISKRGQELDRFSFKGQPNLVSFQRTVAKRVKDLEDDLYGADGEAGAVSLSRVKVPGRGHSYQSLGEDSSTSSDEAESAILKRIMVAHLDLLKEFGPQKVMQAVEEVAYNVGCLLYTSPSPRD